MDHPAADFEAVLRPNRRCLCNIKLLGNGIMTTKDPEVRPEHC